MDLHISAGPGSPDAPAWWTCRCGQPVFALQPGEEPVYAIGRDERGEQDKRLTPILVKRPVPDVWWCRDCWTRRYATWLRSAKHADPKSNV